MTSVLSKIKNIGEHDFSSALNENLFKIDDLARYGMSGNVSSLAFDPVQSLLAIGTGTGTVHVFGQHNVEVVFGEGSSASPIKWVKFIKGYYLVSVDFESTVRVYSLESKELLYTYTCAGAVSAVESDPALDWLFIGLENGQIIVYDVDRGCQSPFRIGNLQKSVNTKFRMSPVLGIEIHPRDVGTVLVCYRDTAVVFSIAKSEIVFNLRYELPPGAPGGELNPSSINQYRNPQFLSAIWHPNGHHILSTHIDGSLVFWDGTEGNLLQARTIMDNSVNIPKRLANDTTGGVRDQIIKVTWNCTTNPEDTSIIVAGGSVDMGFTKGLSMLDFGPTPSIAITSYQNMGVHYSNPKRHKIYPLPEGVDVIDFIMVSSTQSPYYKGNQAPSHIIILLSTGELLTMNYFDGMIVTDPTLLPPSLAWINPYVSCISVSVVPRNQWVGMMNATPNSDKSIFNGGAPARRHLRSFQHRTALCTGHRDGTVKLWDASHGELEDSRAMEVSCQNALQSQNRTTVTHISLAAEVAELAVAVENGEVILFDFKRNKNQLSSTLANLNMNDNSSLLKDISYRAPANIKEGFLPQILVQKVDNSRITSLNNSKIGFVAIGYACGRLVVIDRRVPAVIYQENCFHATSSVLSRRKTRTSFTSSPSPSGTTEYPTTIEFGLYALGDDGYSSIVLSVGTSAGNVYTFKIVPSQNGYIVDPVGYLNVGSDPIIHLTPIDMATGTTAVAEPENLSKLASGIVIPGAIIAITKSEGRVFRQPNSKVTHKYFNFICTAAGTSFLRENDSFALTCLTDKSQLKIMAIPSMRDICTKDLPMPIDAQYSSQSVITRTGDIILRQDKTSGALIRIWGRGVKLDEIATDALYDVMKINPPRPTISTIQWVKGKQYLSIEDLDNLIGGPRRPKSKSMLEREKAQKEQERLVRLKKQSSSSSRESFNRRDDDEGGAFSGVQNTFNDIGQSTSEFMSGFDNMVKDAKTGVFKASFKSRFFG